MRIYENGSTVQPPRNRAEYDALSARAFDLLTAAPNSPGEREFWVLMGILFDYADKFPALTSAET